MSFFISREGPGCEQTEIWRRCCHFSNANRDD